MLWNWLTSSLGTLYNLYRLKGTLWSLWPLEVLSSKVLKIGSQFCLAFLLLWLAHWCLAHVSAVWRLAPSAPEESAECWRMQCKATWLWPGDPSLTPVFVPSTYVFSKALAFTVPHRISPPCLMWSHTSALWVLEWCVWGNTTRDKTSPHHPHYKCECVWMQPVVCLSLATVALLPSCHSIVVCVCMLTCAIGIHAYMISVPLAL